MRRIFVSLLILLLAGITQGAFADGNRKVFFEERYGKRLDVAKRLHASRRYADALECLRELHKDVDSRLEDYGFRPEELPDSADFGYYLNVLNSEAECAYMLNLSEEVSAITRQSVNAINERYDYAVSPDADCPWQVGSTYKILGDQCYLLAAENPYYYEQALSMYEFALVYFNNRSNYDPDAINKVYADIAQTYYARGDYSLALDSINKAIRQSRLDVGTNSVKTATSRQSEDQYLQYRADRALCLARADYDYEGALREIDAVIDALPASGKRRLPELKRRKAKILVLQDEDYQTGLGDAVKLYSDYFKAIKDTVSARFLQMTSDQREEYWSRERPFVVDCCRLEDAAADLIYDVTLFNKGMLLQTARSFEDIFQGGYYKDRNKLTQLNAYRQQDTHNAREGQFTTFAADYERLLMQELRRDGREREFFAKLNHTWKDVRRALPKDGCAIEFVEYEKGDADYLAALVVRKDSKRPEFVPLTGYSEFSEISPKWSDYTIGQLFAMADGEECENIYYDYRIKHRIWTDQLISAIGDSRKVYFSPDGYIHQLAIEYMLPEALEDKNFYRLSSTRVLIDGNRPDSRKIRKGGALVLGGIIYDTCDEDDTSHTEGNDADAYNNLYSRGVSFKFLEGTVRECDSILSYRNNPQDKYLRGLEASEKAFYEFSPNYPVLHIATHGVFTGKANGLRDEIVPSRSKDVLSESTLMLSSSLAHLREFGFDASRKDGILSAREIARLDFSGVEMVVASACQTGLGYVTADGVYGFQRAMKSAGAKSMITSLWSVDDDATCVFFSLLYKYIAEGETLCKAFSHARKAMATEEFPVKMKLPYFDAATLATEQMEFEIMKSFPDYYFTHPFLLIDAWE